VTEFEDGNLITTAIISKEQLEAVNKSEIHPVSAGQLEILNPAAAEQIPLTEKQVQE
jgi:hypothetical protein